ncbi:MAG: hypothetical protein QN152_06305 [Armatimonadota bacterium]|nr:hypothetical protein [Armatimonadota bacterium]MDR7474093.1 hypothetical protein [Armatimonadota bacterium]MDR7539132.1 hypothetical protein [Armatimonadota bacterium]
MTRTVVLVVAGILAAGCAGGSAQSGPRFVSVLLADSRESKTEKTVFTPDTSRIYVLFRLAGVPAGTVIKSVWVAEKTGVFEPNTTLDQATMTMGGAQTSGSFWYSRPTNGWPLGEYRVDLYIGERQAETRRFRIEARASSPPTPAVPFASKGWAFENGVYVNQRRGLRIAVPAGWKIGDEARFSERILWVMGRLDPADRERLGVSIAHAAIGQASAEEFFNDDLQGFRQATYQEGGQTKPLFTVLETGKIGADNGVHYIRNTDQSRGLNLYSARNGFGYIVVFKWAADATAEELAELQSVARSAGYGDLPFASAGPGGPAASTSPAPATPVGGARIDPIVFATDVHNGQPVGAASAFPAGTRRIYAYFRYLGLQPEDRLEGTWYKDGQELMKRSATVSEAVGDNPPPAGTLWFWAGWEQGAPTGSYRFELRLNGSPVREGTFQVTP